MKNYSGKKYQEKGIKCGKTWEKGKEECAKKFSVTKRHSGN